MFRYMFRTGGDTRKAFRYWRILLIIIESGMVYSIALICEITLYFLNSNAFYIVYDPIAQLTVRSSPSHYHMPHSDKRTRNPQQAITPTLIIILAALQLTSNDVHSRMTRSADAKVRIRFKPTPPSRSGFTDSSELDTMRFADNNRAAVSSIGLGGMDIEPTKDGGVGDVRTDEFVVDYEKARRPASGVGRAL